MNFQEDLSFSEYFLSLQRALCDFLNPLILFMIRENQITNVFNGNWWNWRLIMNVKNSDLRSFSKFISQTWLSLFEILSVVFYVTQLQYRLQHSFNIVFISWLLCVLELKNLTEYREMKWGARGSSDTHVVSSSAIPRGAFAASIHVMNKFRTWAIPFERYCAALFGSLTFVINICSIFSHLKCHSKHYEREITVNGYLKL